MFIELHILASAKLNNAAKNFELKLSEPTSKDTILKYIDRYSLVIEEAIPFYKGNKQIEETQLKEPFNDISEILTDILNNNYALLGKIVNDELSENELKTATVELINKNKYISKFIGQVSLGIFAAIVKDRPKKANKDLQYSRLTENEAKKAKRLIIQLFGENIKQTDISELENGFQMSANILYQGLALEWEYTEK